MHILTPVLTAPSGFAPHSVPVQPLSPAHCAWPVRGPGGSWHPCRRRHTTPVLHVPFCTQHAKAAARWVVRRLRADFPQPHSVSEVRPGESRASCVGGALCQGLRTSVTLDVFNWHFPGVCELAYALQAMNPALGETGEDIEDSIAFRYADALLRSNDARDFAQAWGLVEAALTYRHPAAPEPVGLARQQCPDQDL